VIGSLTNAEKIQWTSPTYLLPSGEKERHAGAKVLLNLGASGALLQQMAKGARRWTCSPPPTRKPWTWPKSRA
jgi:hypothetical protein